MGFSPNSCPKFIDMNLIKFWGIAKDREAWHAEVRGSQKVGHDIATKQQQQSFTHYNISPSK